MKQMGDAHALVKGLWFRSSHHTRSSVGNDNRTCESQAGVNNSTQHKHAVKQSIVAVAARGMTPKKRTSSTVVKPLLRPEHDALRTPHPHHKDVK